MLLDLSGKRAIVTGASRGIGRATAELLAQEGCSLAICARGEEALMAFADELRSRGTKVHAEAFDVAAEGAVGGFVDRAAQALGGLDILVSNVTAGSAKGDTQWATSLATDLLPLVHAIDAALPHFETAGGGSVVAVSSISGLDTATPSSPNSYAAMKAAVIQHASARAHALAAKGVRVNTVSPGPIDFPGGDWDRVREGRPALYEDIRSRIAMGRYGRPSRWPTRSSSWRARRRPSAPASTSSSTAAWCPACSSEAGMGPGGRLDIVLVVGGRWHDMDFARLQLLSELDRHDRVRTRVFEDYGAAATAALASADGLISYTCDVRPDADAQHALVDFVSSGGRWLALHGSNSALDPPEPDGPRVFRTPRVLGEVAQVLGSQFLAHPPIAPYTVEVVSADPLVRGVNGVLDHGRALHQRAARPPGGAAPDPLLRPVSGLCRGEGRGRRRAPTRALPQADR